MQHCCNILFDFIPLQLQIIKNSFMYFSIPIDYLFLKSEMLPIAEASYFYVIENSFEHPIISLPLRAVKCVLISDCSLTVQWNAKYNN